MSTRSVTLPKIESRWLPQRAKRLVAAGVLYWTRLRSRHFDFAISPRWDADEHLATFLCVLTTAARRVGYSSDTSAAKRCMNAGFDAAFDICLPRGPCVTKCRRNLAVARSVGANTDDDRLEIRITDRDRRKAANLLAVSPPAQAIALGIGAHSPGRRWPLAHDAKAMNRLGSSTPYGRQLFAPAWNSETRCNSIRCSRGQPSSSAAPAYARYARCWSVAICLSEMTVGARTLPRLWVARLL